MKKNNQKFLFKKFKLTQQNINDLLKEDKPFKKSDGNGLFLIRNKTSKNPSWRYLYIFNGKQKVYTIGKLEDIDLYRARKLGLNLNIPC